MTAMNRLLLLTVLAAAATCAALAQGMPPEIQAEGGKMVVMANELEMHLGADRSRVTNFTALVEHVASLDKVNSRLDKLEKMLQEKDATIQMLESKLTNLTSKVCGPGLTAVGVSDDGFVICRTDKDTVVNIDCPSNKVVQRINDGTATCTSFEVQAEVDSCAIGFTLQTVALDGKVTCASDELARNLAECNKEGYSYDLDTDRCVPPALHVGCASTAPAGLFGTCSNFAFDDTCTFYCRPGLTSAAAITGKCDVTSQWEITTGEPTCTPVADGAPCPANSAKNLAEMCVCNDGYAGAPVWDPRDLKWNANCSLVAYPDVSTCSGPGQCVCPVGYSGSIVWNRQTQRYDSTCAMQPCPSAADPESFPACTCRFGGTISWNAGAQAWDDSCLARLVSAERCLDLNRLEVGDLVCDPGWYIYNVTSACYGSYQTATGGWNRLTCGDTDYNRDCSIPWDVCTSNCGGSCRSIVLDDYRTLCIKYGSEALQTCGYDLTTSGGLFPNGANICKGKEKGVVVYYTCTNVPPEAP